MPARPSDQPRIRRAGQGVLPAASALLILIVLAVSALCAPNGLPSRPVLSAAAGLPASSNVQTAASVPAPSEEPCTTSGHDRAAAAPASCTGDTAVQAGTRDQNQPGQPSDAPPISLQRPVLNVLPGIPEFIRTRPAVTPSLAQLSIRRT